MLEPPAPPGAQRWLRLLAAPLARGRSLPRPAGWQGGGRPWVEIGHDSDGISSGCAFVDDAAVTDLSGETTRPRRYACRVQQQYYQFDNQQHSKTLPSVLQIDTRTQLGSSICKIMACSFVE